MRPETSAVPACSFSPSLASAAEIGVNATNYDGSAWSPYIVVAHVWRALVADVLLRGQNHRRLLLLCDARGIRGKDRREEAHGIPEILPEQSARGGLRVCLCHLHHHRRIHLCVDRRRNSATNGCTRCGWTGSATASLCVA